MHRSWRQALHGTLLILAALLIQAGDVLADDAMEGILVGRIAHVEGSLLRYVDSERDWVATVRDAPFGPGDTLYTSGDMARAELIAPNGTRIRLGANTQVQLLGLSPDATTVDVASGLVRVENKSQRALVEVRTPFGAVVAPGDSGFDLYVGDGSAEVIAVRGTVEYLGQDGARYPVQAGGPSLIADQNSVGQGNGQVDGRWDDWNNRREAVWAERWRDDSPSNAYLPESLQDESYLLDQYGRWEQVSYEGAYYPMWRPTRIDAGWRPFSVGRWVVYYEDNCWIPDEPFGYLTHHYGAWIWSDPFQSWFWMPPARRVVVTTPAFLPGPGWYPGRVGWLHRGNSIGWMPLAPDEPYYGHRHWGRRTVVLQPGGRPPMDMPPRRFVQQAVIIPRDRLYAGQRYTPVLERNIQPASLAATYQAVPVLDSTVLRSAAQDRRRFSPLDAPLNRKPHTMVLNRIHDNQRLSSAGPPSRSSIEQNLARPQSALTSLPAQAIPVPALRSRLVATDKAPAGALKGPERALKPESGQRAPATSFSSATAPMPGRFGGQGAPGRNSGSQVPSTESSGELGGRQPGMPQQQPMGRQQPQQTGVEPQPRQPGLEQERQLQFQRQQQVESRQQQVEQQQGQVEQQRRQQEVEQERQMQFQRQQQVESQQQRQMEQQRRQQEVEQERQLQFQRQQQVEQQQRQVEQQRRQQEVEQERQMQFQRQQQVEQQQRQVEQQRRQQEVEQERQMQFQRQQQVEQQQRQVEQQRRQQEVEQQRQLQFQRQQQVEQQQRQMEQQRRQQEVEQERQMQFQRQQQVEQQQRQMEQQRRQQEAEQQRQQQFQRQQQVEQQQRQMEFQRQQQFEQQRRQQEAQQQAQQQQTQLQQQRQGQERRGRPPQDDNQEQQNQLFRGR